MDLFEAGERATDPLKEYANRLFTCSVTGAHAVKNQIEGGLPKQIWLSIVFEYLFFYIALTRGYVLRHAAPQVRDQITASLMDVLLSAAVDFVFDDKSPAAADSRKMRYTEEANARIREYDRYESVLSRKESELSETTALWSFCHMIAGMAGQADDITCIMTSHAHVYDSLLILDTETLVATWA